MAPSEKRGLRHRVRTGVPRLSRFAVEHLLLLPLGALMALVWVHTAPESYYSFTFAIAFAVNDVAMALFFALIMKEIVEATAPAGVLHPWRRVMLPVVAAIATASIPHHGSRHQLFRRENHLQAASGRPVSPAVRNRLRRPGVPGTRAVRSAARH